ncbi:MAG: DUF2752 domain-containing protein [Marmoricola sp.]
MALTASTPAPAQPRLRRLGAPLGVAAGVGLASLALHWRDPHQHGSWGLCPFKAVTGWDCPGCGGLRAVNDLGHGQLGAAFASNALFVASIPLLVGFWVLWVGNRWSGSGPVVGERTRRIGTWALVGLAVAFAVFRNTSWGSGLHAS